MKTLITIILITIISCIIMYKSCDIVMHGIENVVDSAMVEYK
jgi:hypothetical protein